MVFNNLLSIYSDAKYTGITSCQVQLGIIDSVSKSIQHCESNIEFLSSLICLAVCKAGASSACLLVTKLALIALY